MGANWFSPYWYQQARTKWDGRDRPLEDTSSYWAEKIPYIDLLESLPNAEVVAIVASVLYPDVEPDYRKHDEIGELHRILTYYRTMKFKLDKLSIGPRVKGKAVPCHEEYLKYRWETKFEFEEWDWDGCNEFESSTWNSPLVAQCKTNLPITRRLNFYGASFDEYPLFMAAKANAESAILRAFVVDDYVAEELPKRAKQLTENQESVNKIGEVYKEFIEGMAKEPFLRSLSDEQILSLIGLLERRPGIFNWLSANLSATKISSIHRKPENLKKMIDLVRVKQVIDT